MMRWLILIIYFLSPLVLAGAIFTQRPEAYSSLSLLLPMLLGVFSYTWLLWQFVMSARPRFIERHFGLDKIYRFHGTMALVALVGALSHKLLKESIFGESPMTTLGEASLLIFAGISALSLVLMTNRIANSQLLKGLPQLAKPITNGIARLKAIKLFTYERLKTLHRLTALGLLLLQVHVLMSGTATASPLIFNLYMAYYFVAMGAYLYQKAIKPWMLEARRYVVSEVKAESAPGVYTLTLAMAGAAGAGAKAMSGFKPLRYQAGQFGYFTLLAEGLPPEAHPFSFSSAPTETAETGKVQVTIKALGDFTRRLSTVKAGDTALVEGPYGSLSYERHPEESSLVLIAGGVGITPMLSMLKELAKTDAQRSVTLLWGIRTPEDLLQQEQLIALEQKMPRLRWLPVVSGDASWPGQRGYIDGALLSRVVANHGVRGTGFYLCGPPPMMAATESALYNLNIPKHQIHKEVFI